MLKLTLFPDSQLSHTAHMCQGVFLGVLWCCSTCVQTYRTGCWGLFCVSFLQASVPPTRPFCALYCMSKSCQADCMEHAEEARSALFFDASEYTLYEGTSCLTTQSFNPFVPTQEQISSMKEQQRHPPPFGKSSHCRLLKNF